jgi:hypothetical protein
LITPLGELPCALLCDAKPTTLATARALATSNIRPIPGFMNASWISKQWKTSSPPYDGRLEIAPYLSQLPSDLIGIKVPSHPELGIGIGGDVGFVACETARFMARDAKDTPSAWLLTVG